VPYPPPPGGWSFLSICFQILIDVVEIDNIDPIESKADRDAYECSIRSYECSIREYEELSDTKQGTWLAHTNVAVAAVNGTWTRLVPFFVPTNPSIVRMNGLGDGSTISVGELLRPASGGKSKDGKERLRGQRAGSWDPWIHARRQNGRVGVA